MPPLHLTPRYWSPSVQSSAPRPRTETGDALLSCADPGTETGLEWRGLPLKVRNNGAPLNRGLSQLLSGTPVFFFC